MFELGYILSPSFHKIKGVPQGSVLSVRFALAINDICCCCPGWGYSCSLYVDDFVLLSGSSLPSAVRRMQLAINKVTGWTDSHGFRFSVEKSHALFFRRTLRVFPELSLTLYVRLLSVVREVRFLYDFRRASDLGSSSEIAASFMSKSS